MLLHSLESLVSGESYYLRKLVYEDHYASVALGR